MPVTSISLDDESYEIAMAMPNRSAFMRECLKRWHALQTNKHIHPTKSPLCFPYSKKGVCSICWPDGIPSHKDWKYFMEAGQMGSDFPLDWIRQKAEERSSPNFELPEEWARSEAKEGGKRSFWAKLLCLPDYIAKKRREKQS